jgi:hypothetical protein
LEFLVLSMRAMLVSPTSAGNFAGGLLGFTSSAGKHSAKVSRCRWPKCK